MAVSMITKTRGKGRPKKPLEIREMLSDHPHHHRKGPKDLPMGETLDMDALPVKPPITMTKYERECWKSIVGTQQALKNRAWIFRSDCAYLIATCGLYGRWREVRDQLNQHHKEGLGYLDENGKANPLINVEAGLAAKYLASLSALGMVPTRRQIVDNSDLNETDDELLR